MVKFVQDHFILFPLVVTAITAGLYMSGMPLGLLKYNIAGNNIFYIANMIFAGIFCIAIIKTLYGGWVFGLNLYKINDSLFRYGWPLILGSLFILIGSYFILRPLNNTPEKGSILIWVVIYYFFVAFVEETFIRGVFFKTLLKWFEIKNNKVIMAIIVSSLIFGLGHIPGMLQQSIQIILIRLTGVIALGIFFGCVYIHSGNLLSVIILHWIINISASILFYYSHSKNLFANVELCMVISIILAIWGIVIIK
jgi:membrane protease YdiL (CAAX protease family)